LFILEEEFQYYKRVIRISNSKKGRQHNDQKKKPHTMIHKTLHRKLKIEQHEPHYKTGVELRCCGRTGSSYSTSDTQSNTNPTQKPVLNSGAPIG
jgi:hypothetical protein